MAYARPPRGANGKFWTARWRDVDGKLCEFGGFVDKQSAIHYALDQETLVRQGKRTKPAAMNMTLIDFVQEVWIPTLDVDEASLKDYEYGLNGWILPEFANTPMKDIKPADIMAWVANMHKSLAERTAEKHRNTLAGILKMAVANEYLHKSPFAVLKFSKAKKTTKVVPLSYEKVESIANRISPRYQLFVWIGYFTGMRAGEILGLSIDQLDFENHEILIDRQLSRSTSEIHKMSGLKTDASERTIGFARELERMIQAHIEKYGLGPHGLILSTVGNKVFRYKGAIEMFRNAARPEGIPRGQGLHILRHTCVSVLIKQGASPKDIQAWVGHTSIQETMDTYGHLFPDSKHNLALMLDNNVPKRATQSILGEVG